MSSFNNQLNDLKLYQQQMGIVNKAEVDIFSRSLAFFGDATDVGNFISDCTSFFGVSSRSSSRSSQNQSTSASSALLVRA